MGGRRIRRVVGLAGDLYNHSQTLTGLTAGQGTYRGGTLPGTLRRSPRRRVAAVGMITRRDHERDEVRGRALGWNSARTSAGRPDVYYKG